MDRGVFVLTILVLVLLPLQGAFGICVLPPPIDDDLNEDPPTLPVPTPDPEAGTPTPGPGPGGGPVPTTPRGRVNPRSGTRTGTGARGVSLAGAWHLWWELNREHLLGLRGTLADREPVSGGPRGGPSPMDDARVVVRAALRQVLSECGDEEVRAAVLGALGRAGDDEDATRFIELLRAPSTSREIAEAAAIGLGCLPGVKREETRAGIRELYDDLLDERTPLRSRTRRLALVAIALQARQDPSLAASIARRTVRAAPDRSDAAALLYACGLTRDPLVAPLLYEAAGSGRLGATRIDDVARSHAVLGLAVGGDTAAVSSLARLLGSRRTPLHSRRSAAIALGVLLRDAELGARPRREGERALLLALDRDRDVLVRCFAVASCGTAPEPFATARLLEQLDKGDLTVRPFAALALGLSVRTAEPEERARVTGVLKRELGRTHDPQLRAALAIGLGVSGDRTVRGELAGFLEREREAPAVRGPAIQGLGLLRAPTPDIEAGLVAALGDPAEEVVEDACLALGLLGRRSTAGLLARELTETPSVPVQRHMVAALAHLGSTAAIEPLLAVLQEPRHEPARRVAAASALGLLVDDRESDPLFEIDTCTNPYALTQALRPIVLVY